MVYEPQEDSFLLKSAVKRFARGRVLDVGTGSGLLAVEAVKSRKVKEVFGVDVDGSCVDFCKKKHAGLGVRWLVSDLFGSLRSFRHYFDTIFFNPPYLPQENKEMHVDLEGGKSGFEVIRRFLFEVNFFLKEDGFVFLLFSSRSGRNNSGKEKIDDFIGDVLMDFEMISNNNFFFEELFVYKIFKSDLLKCLERKKVENVCFFARGKRGVVFTGFFRSKKVAVKIKRQESLAVGTVEKEAKWLKFFNKHNIGPEFLFSSDKFIVYEFVEGVFFRDFLKNGCSSEVRFFLRQLLKQCFVMDCLGVFKDEMNRPLKNAVVCGKKVVIIDFERCRKTENPHNVTQLCDFILKLSRFKFELDSVSFLKAVKLYSSVKSKKNFERLVCFLR